ncbi:hypothetical protein V500_02195 [Pseudogymnoascus sp. VKM F-4518 (FW-2643)]|nr:hypothetical protein V500_02195 [Pseudogymnoascus sp. VKM F-4518 (FW-2643)]OBT40100.1 hypothetical protein VE00_10017 [Pseudogymnoascus sp. WSF 3629]
MATLKNILLYGLFATAVVAAPAAVADTSPSTVLIARKNTNKCEAHIHFDGNANSLYFYQPRMKPNLLFIYVASNQGCTTRCTSKYHIDLLDNQQPPQPMGYDFNWEKVGTWGATNPDYQIKIKTTKGLELWIDGKLPRTGAHYELSYGNWRKYLTLNYGSQHWNSISCENYALKEPGQSNGWRLELDLWCEFDC